MAINKLTIPQYVDGSTKIMATDLNAIVSKVNELVDAANGSSSGGSSGGGSTPTAPSAPTITINGTSATISAVSGATIKYTIDGSNPSASVGTTYSGAITLNVSCTIKAVAIKDGLVSSVASKTYTEEVVDTSVGNDNLKWIYGVNSSGGDKLSNVRTFGYWDITDVDDFYIKLTVPESSPLKASVMLKTAAGMEGIDMISPSSYDSPAPSSDYTAYASQGNAMTDKGWITPGNSMEYTRASAFTGNIAGLHVFYNNNASGYARLTLEEIIASGITLEFRHVKKHLNNG